MESLALIFFTLTQFDLCLKGMFLRELMHDKLTKGYFIGILCRVSRS